MLNSKVVTVLVFAFVISFGFSACEKQGKMEEMGEKADEMMEDAGDKIGDMADELKKKAKEAKEAVTE